MPGLAGRISTLTKAKISHMLERAEDPGETLDYAYERQLEDLQNVKRGIADVVTAKKRLQLQEEDPRHHAGQLGRVERGAGGGPAPARDRRAAPRGRCGLQIPTSRSRCDPAGPRRRRRSGCAAPTDAPGSRSRRCDGSRPTGCRCPARPPEPVRRGPSGPSPPLRLRAPRSVPASHARASTNASLDPRLATSLMLAKYGSLDHRP
jgi:hypothetical protein